MPEGYFKHMKTRVDFLDKENYVGKFTLVEGDALGHELEKGDVILKEEDIKATLEHTMGLYKSCADYLIANPHICV
ncbi:major allergen Pru ar 1-like [Olea europaea var. sylvestris]|uniref:major allergen Pru ar 1-like n=1 Tax=Olea europaea var. sylvestris TaxID=158386 RepID=UPI000C1D5B86|nr:major allergen Pru ar 1-like [Olea europaea var. sylvestris]